MLVTAFVLWGCLHAVVAAPEVELITEPRAGEEYVFFKAAVSGRNLDVQIANKTTTAAPQTTVAEDETTVPTTFQTDAYDASNTELPTESKEEVQTEVSVVISKEMHINGRVIKQEQHKKMENVKIVPDDHESSQNKEEAASEVIEFKSEAEIGLLNRPSFEGKRGDTFTVPTGKFQSIDKSQHTAAVPSLPDLPPLNILSTGSRKPSEGHDIIAKGTSSHLPLQAAGTQTQSSRINVKKAPNGQEYEYEYIYYYDDEEESPEGDKIDLEEDLSKPASSTTSTTTTTTTTTTESPQEYIPEPIPERTQHLRKEDDRYTTINRVRGHHRAEPVEYQTEVPFVNEINTPIRHSGRQQHALPEVEEQPEEERLPVATRFPPRGGHQLESVPAGRVRPSLELVDSKSFRTGAASADTSNSGTGGRFNAAAVTEEVATPHREETYVQPPAKTRVRSTTTTSTTTTTTTTTTTEAPEAELTEDPEVPATERPSKAAYDLAALYANIQSADDERVNEVVETAQADEVTTEEAEDTTVPETTVLPSSTTTTTTTTTEAPTTTEARTRGRIRPGAGSRKPIGRDHSRSRKPSTEAPTEVKSIQPQAGRTRSRQRGYSASFSTAAPEEEAVKDSAAPVANAAPAFATKTRTSSIKNAIHRPNFPRRRGPPSRTPAPTAAEEKQPEEEAPAEGEPINVELAPAVPSTTTTTTSRPRPIATRPRSPSLLLRSRNRVGLPSTTAAPATSEQSSEEASAPEAPAETSSEASQPPQEDSTQAQSTTAAPTGLNRLRKRPLSLVVTEKPKKPAAAASPSPVSRRQLLARPRRPGPLAASTAEPKASTESEVGATNSEEAEASAPEAPSSTTTSTAAPEVQTTESLVSSLIKKRAGRKPGHFRSRGAASE